MAYGTIDPAIWDDEDFLQLSSDAQLLWLYLLTGPEALAGVPGLILTTVEGLASARRRGTVDTAAHLDELKRRKWVRVDGRRRMVQIPNAPHYRKPGNSNVVTGWYRRWRSLPKSKLKIDHLRCMVEAWSQTESDKILARLSSTFGRELANIPKDSKGGGGGSVPPESTSQSALQSTFAFDANDSDDSTGEESALESAFESSDISSQYQRSGSVVRNVDPEPPPGDERDGKRGKLDLIGKLWEIQETLKLELGEGVRREIDMAGEVVISRALDQYSFEELENALRVDAARAAQDPTKLEYFNGSSNWHPRHLERVVGQVMPVSTGHHRVTGLVKFRKGNVLGND